MSWSDPVTWVLQTVLSASLLNAEIRDNLNYLKQKPITIDTDTTNFVKTTTVWEKIPNIDLQIILDVSSHLEFSIKCSVSHSVNHSVLRWDIWDVDNSVYLSSGTATPAPKGLGTDTLGSTTNNLFAANYVELDVPLGTHNYEVHIDIDAATLTISHSGGTAQYIVREI